MNEQQLREHLGIDPQTVCFCGECGRELKECEGVSLCQNCA